MSGNKKSKTQSEQESNYTLIQCAGIRNLVLLEYRFGMMFKNYNNSKYIRLSP